MAVTALHTAATGLNALSTEIDVVANNLANVNTTAFKGSRVNFEDLLYQEKAQPGVEDGQGNQAPAGLFVGLGVRVANTDMNFMQGSPIQTDQPLDMMIKGDGFFTVDSPQSPGGMAYTRAGNFFVNADGEVVLGNHNGPRLQPGISVPDNTTTIDLSADGHIVFTMGDGTTSEADIQISNFINPKGLRAVGSNLYEETAASGAPVTGTPGTDGLGEVLQGYVENSNVDPVKELVELIKAQRAFELNSQSIQAADQSLQVIGNLRR